MNLSKIKQKYKQILEQNEPNSNDSDNEWELAYSRMKNKRRKHILTESQCVNRSSISMQGHGHGNGNGQGVEEEKLLRVKEKLAQSLANLGKKDGEIEQLRVQNIKHKQHTKLLESQLKQLKQALSESQNKLLEQKIQSTHTQKTLESITHSIQSQKLDKELLQRQIEYYQAQIEQAKREGEVWEGKIEELRKEIRGVDRVKRENGRLREDCARLCELLGETEKYRVFASKLEYKNYVGKPCKEHQCWVSQDLVQDVQNFLRKQHIGSGNKQFTNSLIKFISKNLENTKAHTQKKLRKLYNSKLKDQTRKQNHSMNLMQIRQQQQKKANGLGAGLGNSLVKSRRHTHTLNDSKLFTESFIYGSLDKSHITHQSQSHTGASKSREVCMEILASFRKGAIELLEAKEVKRKKLGKLIDWAVEGVMGVFPRERPMGDFRLETEEIKITL